MNVERRGFPAAFFCVRDRYQPCRAILPPSIRRREISSRASAAAISAVTHLGSRIKLFAIVEHALAQHPRQGSHDLQQNDIVAGIMDGDMQIDIGFGPVAGIGLFMRPVEGTAFNDPDRGPRRRPSSPSGGTGCYR